MNKIITISGQSFVFNLIFTLLNLSGLTFITLGFQDSFESSKVLFVSMGFGLILLSIVGILIFKGRLLMATVSRILVGSLFIVSGLIKANDPIGFSYKLEEYFEDGALAFRIKEWFGMPGFSLEFLIEWALVLSVVICIAEIVLGVLVLIGGKIKLVSWMLLGMMIFFTFLTWHTSNCDSTQKFVDRDTYALNSQIARIKLDESKTNKDIKIVSKSNGELVVDEMKTPQCVLDCGCFGDAMKGSLGRSLTPKESLWKDIVLLYLVIWIFITQRRITPNTGKENLYIVTISMIFILFFSYIFGWYFPFVFGLFALLGSLWILRAGGKFLGNYYGSIFIVKVMCLLMVGYVLMYEPIKDYRPYALGSDLNKKMNDGVEGVYQSMLVYKNLKNGSTKEYDGSSKEYINSKIWEKTDVWKYDTMITKEIIPTKMPSITQQFEPSITVNEVGKQELKLAFVQEKMNALKQPGYLLFDKTYNNEIEVLESEYDPEFYDTTGYTLLKKIEMLDPNVSEISVLPLILTEKRIFVLFSKDLNEGNFSSIEKIKAVYAQTQKDKIPFIIVCSNNREDIEKWRTKYQFNAAVFLNDPTELKAVSRSNPSLMIFEKGVVVGKFPHRSIPSYTWIQKQIYNK